VHFFDVSHAHDTSSWHSYAPLINTGKAEGTHTVVNISLTSLVHTLDTYAQVYGHEVAKQVQRLYPQFRCLAWGQLNALFTNQLLEHPELQVVWDELLSAGTGEDIYLKRPMHYLNTEEVKNGKVEITFAELEQRVHERGETIIGYYRPSVLLRERGVVQLNPAKHQLVELDVDKIAFIVISSDDVGSGRGDVSLNLAAAPPAAGVTVRWPAAAAAVGSGSSAAA